MAGRPLDERTLAALRPAFASEVARRLPSMQAAAADVLTTGRVAAARRLRHHAHTLAASAALLGEALASEYARACERAVAPSCEGRGRVPGDVAGEAARHVEALALLLAGWLATGGTA